MNKKSILFLTLTASVFAFCKDGESKEERDKRITESEQEQTRVLNGMAKDGSPLYPNVLFSVAFKKNPLKIHAASIANDHICGIDVPENDDIDKKQWDAYLRDMAKQFVVDAGGFCNENVLNSYEGFQGLKRLWFNRKDYETRDVQMQIDDFIKSETKHYYGNDCFEKDVFWAANEGRNLAIFHNVWESPKIASNPVVMVKKMYRSHSNRPDTPGADKLDQWLQSSGSRFLVSGEADAQFDQYVREELQKQNVVPYTREEVGNMDIDQLEKLFPSNFDYSENDRVRVFSHPFNMNDSFEASIVSVLQRFFGLPRVFVN